MQSLIERAVIISETSEIQVSDFNDMLKIGIVENSNKVKMSGNSMLKNDEIFDMSMSLKELEDINT